MGARTFTLAHLSDLHLGPLPRLAMGYWNIKRTLGWLNWTRSRRDAHRPEVLARIVEDMKLQAPDHIAVTGDLCNIGLPGEYEAAAVWLETLGPHERVSVVPGNHDVYCRLASDAGVARWARWMAGDADARAALESLQGHRDLSERFPYVRHLGGVAVLGLNSAIETRPFHAVGHLGAGQLGRLAAALDRLGRERQVRVVLVHHPALPGQAPVSHALRDAAALEGVLTRHGAELVLHGHKHRRMLAERRGPDGTVSFVGVPSASFGRRHRHDELARYHLYRLTPGAPSAPIELIARGLAEPDGPIVELERRLLARVPTRSGGATA